MVFSGLGIELVGLILTSVWLGPKVDEYFQTRGIMFVVILVFVLIGWFVRLLFLIKKMEKSD
jgi:hypothetical protein